MTIKELEKACFVFYSSYGNRRTAESVADLKQEQGFDTAIRQDKLGNHLVYIRRAGL